MFILKLRYVIDKVEKFFVFRFILLDIPLLILYHMRIRIEEGVIYG